MLRHIVLLRLNDSADEAARDRILKALRGLAEEIPQIRSLTATADAGLADGNADIALEVEVDDVEAWRAYQQHPAHKRVITEHIAPVLVERAAIQLQLST